MRSLLAVLFFTLVTALCWGIYGPVLRNGQEDMLQSSLRPFICVGLAYFAIAVVVPLVLLKIRGEAGAWTVRGTLWSLAAGAAGALGALGIILAFRFRGNPVFVMPLVFGSAPVVNTFITMGFNRTGRQAGALFYAGLILVITGAVTVLLFRPDSGGHGAAQELTVSDWVRVALAVALAGLSWGAYGPVLHKGQVAMQGSRLRPLVCVGLAYCLIAVLVPVAILSLAGDRGEFTVSGTLWSLAGGSAGAIGALGVIMAFTFGGKPVYVMPLIFGTAPVINTFVTMTQHGNWNSASPVFYAGLLIVVAGAVTVLVFAPKAGPHMPKPALPKQPAKV